MCGCTPGGLARMRGFGIACAPRTEDSGMAGPERPFRAVTATEGRGALIQHNGSAGTTSKRPSVSRTSSW